MTRHRGGDDPTRREAGGSRTETKITELSEQGTDNSSDGPPASPETPTDKSSGSGAA